MPQVKLNEVVMPTDRWSARVVSPVEIGLGIDTERYGDVVVLHPGWGKDPERHAHLLTDLADNGFLPLGVDTRYAYSDRRQPCRSVLTQPRLVGDSNPYFPATKAGNRWMYRRPTVLLDICERLGIEDRSYVGHSEGGRVVTLAALAQPEAVKKLVVVNGVGTGDSSGGLTRLMRSNSNSVGRLKTETDGALEMARSAASSVMYAASHLRRTVAEKQVIQSARTWEILGQLAGQGMDVTVMHAEADELISFEDSHSRSELYPAVEFVPTHGTHSNVYEGVVRGLIVEALGR